jgi:hypothetical protein
MMTKVIAVGLVFGPDTYLHSGWNAMDGLLVLTSIVDLAAMHPTALIASNPESEGASRLFSMLRVFRLLRTLRPLRGEKTKMFCFIMKYFRRIF